MNDTAGPGRVLIVGGASGVGSTVADAVSHAGGQPIVMDLVAPRRSHVHFAVDLADTQLTESVACFIAADGLDAVITCAPLDTVGSEDPEGGAAGTAVAIEASMGALIESQGQVFAVGSTLGPPDPPGASALCASEFDVVGHSSALTAGSRVRITCVGATGSPNDSAPTGPSMDPVEVAQVIVDLLHARGPANPPQSTITPGRHS